MPSRATKLKGQSGKEYFLPRTNYTPQTMLGCTRRLLGREMRFLVGGFSLKNYVRYIQTRHKSRR
jgi:hypothetical protein